jgi:hypothetical protein
MSPLAMPKSAQSLLERATSGEISVAEIYAALRDAQINQVECDSILSALERARVPAWKRLVTSL